ncbi:medium-chain acyl-CoA ligase ACSF2, mitochondrial [Teleopsis dalmanni]|uniref:medium-chain acyl-CoA ligase ACSF2, mitochondrial n=1 Tax=Teleopsis dalmanni TaxID=139649 RepID=UPI0018CE8474|nr:medium-chain acyl-CoA ligase ACSF2, mitochondrial [Teleopsis dalmanni]
MLKTSLVTRFVFQDSKYAGKHKQILFKLPNNADSRKNYSQRAYVQNIGKEPLIYRNLGEQIYRAAEKYGNRPAVISCYEHQTLSFIDVTREAENLAVKLKDLGLNRGDHLAIWAPNTIQWYITFLAAGLSGLPLVCMNPALQAPEVEYALRKAKVKAIITMDSCGKQNFYDILKTVLSKENLIEKQIKSEKFPLLRNVLVKYEKSLEDFISFAELLAQPINIKEFENLNKLVKEISPDSICNIQFTSGTTGQAKATLLSHFSHVNVGHLFGQALSMHEGHKRICLTVPLFHAFGLGILTGSLDYGATLIMPSPTFNGAAAIDAIEKESCNVVVGTPTMFVDMLEKQQDMQRSMKSLELALVGGAACSPEVFLNVKTVFSLKRMRIGYGLSEATGAIFAQDDTDSLESAVLSVGKLFEHGEAKVINAEGQTVAYGESGELCVRGFFTMLGYLDDEVKTREILSSDGWLRTGDEFVMEPTAVGRIMGRKKDIIIRGGENIFPKEIEDFLDTHDDILEAQIIGVPDKRMGEEICAFLRLRPGVAILTVDDIKQFCKGKIAHFKIPKYVQVVDDFPKTTSGKIQKFKLSSMFNV